MVRMSIVQAATSSGHALLKQAVRAPTQPLKCVTVDVTGTLMGYKGALGDYYCMAAKRAGLPCPDYERMHQGFKVAYKEIDQMYPCFGFGKLPNQEWWRICVRKAFCEAGYVYTDEQFEAVFLRIYGIFGSSAPYESYADAKPFLRWVREQGIVVGILSNASFRYRDDILPQLGLKQGEEWDFGVFSGIEGVEKPNPEIFKIALSRAGSNILPEEALHIGDSLRKDFVPAATLGMHSLLLNRFDSREARAAKETGVPVAADLLECQHYIAALQEEAKASQLIPKKVCQNSMFHRRVHLPTLPSTLCSRRDLWNSCTMRAARTRRLCLLLCLRRLLLELQFENDMPQTESEDIHYK